MNSPSRSTLELELEVSMSIYLEKGEVIGILRSILVNWLYTIVNQWYSQTGRKSLESRGMNAF